MATRPDCRSRREIEQPCAGIVKPSAGGPSSNRAPLTNASTISEVPRRTIAHQAAGMPRRAVPDDSPRDSPEGRWYPRWVAVNFQGPRLPKVRSRPFPSPGARRFQRRRAHRLLDSWSSAWGKGRATRVTYEPPGRAEAAASSPKEHSEPPARPVPLRVESSQRFLRRGIRIATGCR